MNAATISGEKRALSTLLLQLKPIPIGYRSRLLARLFDKQVLASLWWKSEEDKHFSSITKEECGCTDMTFDP
jgi:hypothetical protein